MGNRYKITYVMSGNNVFTDLASDQAPKLVGIRPKIVISEVHDAMNIDPWHALNLRLSGEYLASPTPTRAEGSVTTEVGQRS